MNLPSIHCVMVFIYVLLKSKLWDSYFVLSILVKICVPMLCTIYILHLSLMLLCCISIKKITDTLEIYLLQADYCKIKFKATSNNLKKAKIKAVFRILPDFHLIFLLFSSQQCQLLRTKEFSTLTNTFHCTSMVSPNVVNIIFFSSPFFFCK